jgi:type VI secretion system secreted protein VgrG
LFLNENQTMSNGTSGASSSAAPAKPLLKATITKTGGTACKKKKAPPPVKTGLGAAVDNLVNRSPTLERQLRYLLGTRHIGIVYGPAGGGTFSDRNAGRITVDSNDKGNPNAIVQSLSHEVGHLNYHLRPEVKQGKLTKAQYVQRNVQRHLDDEGAATLNNITIRAEIQGHGGPDIGVAGSAPNQYINIANKHPKNPAKARREIGNYYSSHEHPSNSPGQTYGQYYSTYYQNKYKPPAAGGHKAAGT